MSTFPPPSGPGTGPARGAADRSRRGPSYGQALLATLVWAGLSIVASAVLVGPPASAETAGRFVGGLVIPSLLAALVTRLLARRIPVPAFWQLVALALPAFLVLRLFFGALQAVGAGT